VSGARSDAVFALAELRHRAGVEAAARGEPALAARELRRALRRLGIALTPANDDASSASADLRPGQPAQPAQPAHPNRLEHPDHRALVAKILTSLAHAEAEQGRTALGFALLVRCDAFVDPGDPLARGTLYGQRGLLLLRTGKAAAAIAELDRAVEILDPAAVPVELARALLNRTVARLQVGQFAGARADSLRCRELAERAGRPQLAAKALHNIGYCDLLEGDLPAALRTIGEAVDGTAGTAGVSPSWRSVVMVDIGRALLQAGLASDAARELDAAIDLLRRQRMSQDLAEAQAVRAEAALLGGDAEAARSWARTARAGFRRRGNASGAAAAELIEVEAELRLVIADGAADRTPAIPAPDAAEHRARTRRALRVARRAEDLAARLRVLGLRNDAAAAELVGLLAALAAGAAPGRTAGPRPAQALPSISKTAPLDLRMLRSLTAAELAVAHGDPGRALLTLRSGLALLARRRSGLGSVDLQTGTAALGVELAAAGLALTVDRPRRAFAWSELSRAQSLRIRPVRPPTDPDVAQAVAELRSLEFSRREAVLSGAAADQPWAGRQAALEQRIRRSAWRAEGSGAVAKVAELDDVADQLRRRDIALVSLFKKADTLFALVVVGTQCRVIPLGPVEGVYETARRLRADIVALVGRVLPARMEKALAQAVAAHAESLDAALFGSGLRELVGDRELVVVPCGPLAATPWSLLPALRGRPLSVAPSATSWLAAARAAPEPPAAGDGSRTVVLVAGPGLRRTADELAAVASCYQDPVVLDGAEAGVRATLAALDGAATAHLAVHGHHDPENPLFSRLELAGGPLMAYDLLYLDAVPQHVVLSACDVGRISMRPGDEPLGLVATLLHAGSRTVVAAAAPVADAVAAEVMGQYHRSLRAGQPPAAALAAATAANPLAAFSCFGAG